MSPRQSHRRLRKIDAVNSFDKGTNVVTAILRYGFIILAVDLLALTIAFAVGIDLVFAPDRLLNKSTLESPR